MGKEPIVTLLIVAAALAGVLCTLPPVAAGTEPAYTDVEKRKIVYQMYADGKKDFPRVKDLSPQQAKDLLKQRRLVFVDTRKPAEMKISMLPGAITKKQYLVEPNRYKDHTVVSYCTISYRSGIFAREMGKKGDTVYNLKGGILAWTLEGGSVYDPDGRETKQVHVYGLRWNYAPDGYQTVRFSLWEQIF